MTIIKLRLCIFSLCTWFVYCSPTLHRPALSLENASFQSVLRVLTQNFERLRTFKGTASISIETPEKGYSASARIVIDRPDTLYIKIEAAFGIDVGWMFVNEKLYTIYIPSENAYYYGAPKALDLESFISFQISSDKLMQTFAGMELAREGVPQRLYRDKKALVLESMADSTMWRYWIDPEKGMVVRTEARNRHGELTLQATFERFMVKKGLWVPGTIRVYRPLLRQRLTLFYHTIAINESVTAKDIKLVIPRSAKGIKLDG